MKEQKVQISLTRLAQVASLGQKDQFSYLFSLRVERMDEVECRNLRALVFSLDATTEDEIQFRNSINRMTTVRFEQLERRKQWALDEFEKKPPAKAIEKIKKPQTSLVSEIFGYLKRFISSSPILATAQTDRPNYSSITLPQEEEDKFLQNSSSEPNRKSK